MVKAQQWLNEKFPDVEKRKKVKTLSISNGNKENDTAGQVAKYFYNIQLEGDLNLNEFINLQYLHILGDSTSISRYQRLNKIKIGECTKLTTLSLHYLSENFEIDRSISFAIMTQRAEGSGQNVFSLRNLANLSVQHCPELSEIRWLDQFVELNKLTISSCPQLAKLDLTKNEKLAYFSCHSNDNLREIKGLEKLVNLTVLDVNFCPLTSLNGIANLVKLNSLSVVSCYNLKSIDDISRLSSLNQINLNGCSKLVVKPWSLLIEQLDEKNEQLDELSNVVSPGRISDFAKLKEEIIKLKIADLILQLENKKTEFEKLIASVQEKGAMKERIDFLLKTQGDMIKGIKKIDADFLVFKSLDTAKAYVWRATGDEEEVERLCDAQAEVIFLEQKLSDLQHKQISEQIQQLQMSVPLPGIGQLSEIVMKENE